MEKKDERILHLGFGVYLCFLILVLFYRGGPSASLPYWDLVRQRVNLRPFATIALFLRLLKPRFRRRFWKIAVLNLLGNLVLFVPVGYLLPDISQRVNRWWKVFFSVSISICLVELLQLALLVGSCDVDDLILNVLGAMIGYWLRPKFHQNTRE